MFFRYVRLFFSLCLATDVTNISQTLRVDSVDLQDGRGVAVTVSFKVHTCKIYAYSLTQEMHLYMCG